MTETYKESLEKKELRTFDKSFFYTQNIKKEEKPLEKCVCISIPSNIKK